MSLAVLLSINAHKIQSARIAVGEYARQSRRLHTALEKLEQYRLDYRALSDTDRLETVAVFADQRLFLQRIDDNIMALREQYTEVVELLENAQQALKSATDNNEALTEAVNRNLDRLETLKQRRIQAECDETGRIINGRFRHRKPFH